QTNAYDLRPGIVFSIGHHARTDLDGEKLLVTELSIEGRRDEGCTATGHAVLAAHAYHPARTTAKPQVHGAQSAGGVGPAGARGPGAGWWWGRGGRRSTPTSSAGCGCASTGIARGRTRAGARAGCG